MTQKRGRGSQKRGTGKNDFFLISSQNIYRKVAQRKKVKEAEREEWKPQGHIRKSHLFNILREEDTEGTVKEMLNIAA